MSIFVIFLFEQIFHKLCIFIWTFSHTSYFCSRVLHLSYSSTSSLSVSIFVIFFVRTNFSQIVFFHLDIQSHKMSQPFESSQPSNSRKRKLDPEFLELSDLECRDSNTSNTHFGESSTGAKQVASVSGSQVQFSFP